MSVLWISIIGSFIASISTKLIADAFLKERIAILGDFLGLRYALNPGVAFSIDLGRWQALIIIGALIAICAVAFRSAHTLWSQLGYGILIGGALVNVVDRLPDGFVTDFFQVGTFPIFNVADSCITVGVIMLLAESLLLRKQGNVK